MVSRAAPSHYGVSTPNSACQRAKTPMGRNDETFQGESAPSLLPPASQLPLGRHSPVSPFYPIQLMRDILIQRVFLFNE